MLPLQPKLLRSRHHLHLLRHFCSEHNPPLRRPSPKQSTRDRELSTITQALDLLLTTPDNEWTSSAQIKNLLFSSATPSSQLFFQITRRFPSYSKALAFFNFIQCNLPSEGNTQLLSHAYQAVFELAVREPASPENVFNISRVCKDQNIPLSINSATLLMRFFGKVSMYDRSFLLYNELDENLRSTHVRNVLIDVFLKCDCVRDAFNVLDEMLEPESKFPVNENTRDIVLYALVRREDVAAKELVGLVRKFAEHGVFSSTVCLTRLISRLFRNRSTKKAWDFVHMLTKSNAPLEAVSCNALLNALSELRDLKAMVLLFAEMKENGVEPDFMTFRIIINSLCKLCKVDEALEVFEKMNAGKESGELSFEPDVIMFNTLIDGLCKVGRQEEGLNLMKRMRMQKGCAPNTITYNCIIDGFCKSGNIGKSQEFFHLMEEEGLMPNVITLNILIDSMCRRKRINSAVDFFREAVKKGLRPNAVTYTALINAFCKVNNFQEAMKWFDDMCIAGCAPDAGVYFTLISGLCQAGRMKDAIVFLSKLKEAGFCPDIVCYNDLIKGFCKTNTVDKVYKVLREMEEIGIKPDSVTYNTLISFLSKCGNFSAARRVLKLMVKGELPTVVTHM